MLLRQRHAAGCEGRSQAFGRPAEALVGRALAVEWQRDQRLAAAAGERREGVGLELGELVETVNRQQIQWGEERAVGPEFFQGAPPHALVVGGGGLAKRSLVILVEQLQVVELVARIQKGGAEFDLIDATLLELEDQVGEGGPKTGRARDWAEVVQITGLGAVGQQALEDLQPGERAQLAQGDAGGAQEVRVQFVEAHHRDGDTRAAPGQAPLPGPRLQAGSRQDHDAGEGVLLAQRHDPVEHSAALAAVGRPCEECGGHGINTQASISDCTVSTEQTEFVGSVKCERLEGGATDRTSGFT
ncbi:MAG: hypothetical protein M5U01_27030 [Ardenticatenaceae bacterium]|nr:hypothetical protein [Ardenticatenaceae bacterium]